MALIVIERPRVSRVSGDDRQRDGTGDQDRRGKDGAVPQRWRVGGPGEGREREREREIW